MTLLSEIQSAGPERQRELIERVWQLLNGDPWIVFKTDNIGTIRACSQKWNDFAKLLDCGAFESAAIGMVPVGWRIGLIGPQGEPPTWQVGVGPDGGRVAAAEEASTFAFALLAALVQAKGIGDDCHDALPV